MRRKKWYIQNDQNGDKLWALCYAAHYPLWRWYTQCEELCRIETFVLHHKNEFANTLDDSYKCVKHAYSNLFADKSKFDILFSYLVANSGVPSDLLD